MATESDYSVYMSGRILCQSVVFNQGDSVFLNSGLEIKSRLTNISKGCKLTEWLLCFQSKSLKSEYAVRKFSIRDAQPRLIPSPSEYVMFLLMHFQRHHLQISSRVLRRMHNGGG